MQEVVAAATEINDAANAATDQITSGIASEAGLAGAEVLALDAMNHLNKALSELDTLDLSDFENLEAELQEIVTGVTGLCQDITQNVGDAPAGILALTIVETIYGIPPGTLSSAVGIAGDLCGQIRDGDIDITTLGVEEVEEEEEEEEGMDYYESKVWYMKSYLQNNIIKTSEARKKSSKHDTLYMNAEKYLRAANRQVNFILELDADDTTPIGDLGVTL